MGFLVQRGPWEWAKTVQVRHFEQNTNTPTGCSERQPAATYHRYVLPRGSHHRPHISISTSPQSERPLKRLSVSRYHLRLDRGHFSSIGGSYHEEEESLVPSDG